MKKSIILILAFCYASISLFAQNDTIRYDVVRDDPFTVPKMYINVLPAHVYIASISYLNFGAKVQWNISKKFSLRAEYYRQYPKASLDFSTEPVSAVKFEYEKTDFSLFDAGVDFVLVDKVRTEDGSAIIKSNTTRTRDFAHNTDVTLITNQVIQTKVQHRVIKKVRVGVMQQKSNFHIGDKTVTTTDGSIFNVEDNVGSRKGVQYSNIVYDSLSEYKNYSDINGDVRMPYTISMLYVGYAVNHVRNKVINVKNYGLRGIAKYSSFYIDLMFGKSELSSFQFFKSNPNATTYGDEIGTELIDYTIDLDKSNLKFNPIGMRLGLWMKRPFFSKAPVRFEHKLKRPERLIYMSYHFETGFTPNYGIARGLFLSLGIALDINPF